MTPSDSALGPVARAGAGASPRPSVSFEFSPPKTPEAEESLWEAIRRLEPLDPAFVSVTYGAGGSTRDRTHRTVVRMLKETSLKPAAHLTCVEASRGEVDEVVQAYWDAGIRHIVALRGDPPGAIGGVYTPRADGYRNATELTQGVRAIGDFEVSVGLYPQIHPESPSLEHDIDVLKAKVDAGATRAITQFFFDIDGFLRFMDKVRKAGVGIPICPGIMPVSNYKGLQKMSGPIGIKLPDWLANLFEGLDRDPETRRLIACSVATEMCARLAEEGFTDFHFYTLNRADLVYAICRVLGVREPESRRMTRQDRIAALKAAAKQRILILDGSWGVMIQKRGLAEADYRGARFADHQGQLKGNNDILCLTRPDIVTDLHNAYYGAGADISETNTFSSTAIAQADYELESAVRDLNLEGARLAREAADRWTEKTPDKPRWVAGAMGPLNRMLSMSSDVNDPGARTVTFDQVYEAYKEQARALHEGGVDMFLLETITDTLNVKAGIKAILDLEDEGLEPLPIWISGTITDRSGRTLSGQTVEAFWNSVKHAKPFAVGLNCALGADLMRPHIADLARVADTLVSAYPNAGLPNAMGQYDETPDETGHELHEWAEHGLVNILGGCCGTTPEHIAHVAKEVAGLPPRAPAEPRPALRLAGLEPFELA